MWIIKILKKINLFFIMIFIYIICIYNDSFCVDLKPSLHYGIKNIAKINQLVPLTVSIENRDNDNFKGKLFVNHYENNDSLNQYEFDIDLAGGIIFNKTFDVYLTNNINTFYIQVIDNKGETYLNERYNIDLSSSDNKVIIGVLTNDDSVLEMFNDIYLYDYTMSTKSVKITEEDYIENKNLLNIVDLLVISNIDVENITAGMDIAINNYYISGNPIILATGKNGDNSIPLCFKNLISRPSFNQEYFINFNSFINNTNNDIGNIIKIELYNYDFTNNTIIFKQDDINLISMIRNNNINLLNTSFDLGSIAVLKDSSLIITRILEETFENNRVINEQEMIGNTNDYYNLKNLVDEIDNSKIPNIVYIAVILITYLLLLTLVLFGVLRNMRIAKKYCYYSAALGVVFIIIMYFISLKTRRDNSFLSYISLVEVNDYSSKETSILDFKTTDNNSFSFETNANNLLYPINKINKEPILSLDFINQNNVKTTRIHQDKNIIKVDINNAMSFDSNIFRYENRNYISDKYTIDLDVKLFDGKITGRIHNNMNIDLHDASIYSFGKVIYIGNIKANSSVPINVNRMFNAPIGNNSMCSELMCYYPNTKLIEYYLNNNIKQYFDSVYLFCFIDNSQTIDITSNSLSDKNGKTLIIKRSAINNTSDNMIDLCVFLNRIVNLEGDYNEKNNSISGDNEVINEYEINSNYNINKIYFENLSNYDIGKLNHNVPFYGDIYIYNYKANRYEIVNNNQIVEYFDEYINNNKLRVSFVPNAKDILYRNISLPIIRYIGEKNDKIK